MGSTRKLIIPRSIIKAAKPMSKKVFDLKMVAKTTKSRILSTISFLVVFLIIFSDTFVSNIGMLSKESRDASIMEEPRKTGDVVMQETLDVVHQDKAVDPLIPPSGITTQERIEWFRRILPEIEILNSNDNSMHGFHSRVLEFFNNNCSTQFYMVWLSPARLFGSREFLAVDTLFNTNPRSCLIIVSKSMDSVQGYRILKPLLDLGYRVLAITPDLPFLVKNTPAETWLEEMKSGTKDPGYVPLSINLSNLIRVAMLYRYGGVYLDTDLIILKDFAGLRNVIGAQSIDRATKHWTRINGAVMVFDINHPLLEEFIREFATTFNGNKWGHNGPYLISRVIERIDADPMSNYNFTVLRPGAFYPVDWIKIRAMFKKPENEEDRQWVEDNAINLKRSYAIHLWNKKTKDLIIEDGSVMDRLVQEHCVVCRGAN